MVYLKASSFNVSSNSADDGDFVILLAYIKASSFNVSSNNADDGNFVILLAYITELHRCFQSQ